MEWRIQRIILSITSTMRTITGKELDKKLLKAQGKTWDGVALPRITAQDLKFEAWGRGFVKIKEACAQYDEPLPEDDINEDGIMVLCKASDRYMRILRKNN